MRRWVGALALLAALAAGCGSEQSSAPEGQAAKPAPRRALPASPALAARWVRAPSVKTGMDTNPANLASAVVTHAFGQLPEYIDAGAFRLLPFDMFREASPGVVRHRVYWVTTPRTHLVLNTAVTTAPTLSEAKELAGDFLVAVSVDGRYVQNIDRHWVFYRNNGPQICRIYFPGDLGSLGMGANSVVFYPLTPGVHRIRVDVREHLSRSLRAAGFVTDYVVRVLARRPGAREATIAPDEEGPPPASNRTPFTFRTQSSGAS